LLVEGLDAVGLEDLPAVLLTEIRLHDLPALLEGQAVPLAVQGRVPGRPHLAHLTPALFFTRHGQSPKREGATPRRGGRPRSMQLLYSQQLECEVDLSGS